MVEYYAAIKKEGKRVIWTNLGTIPGHKVKLEKQRMRVECYNSFKNEAVRYTTWSSIQKKYRKAKLEMKEMGYLEEVRKGLRAVKHEIRLAGIKREQHVSEYIFWFRSDGKALWYFVWPSYAHKKATKSNQDVRETQNRMSMLTKGPNYYKQVI